MSAATNMELLNKLEQLVGDGILSRRCEHLSEMEIMDAFEMWLNLNEKAWISVDQLDLEKLKEFRLLARNVELDMRLVIATIPRDHYHLFWQTICALGRRNVNAIREMQLAELRDGIDQFVGQLKAQNINVTRNQLVSFVNESRFAIEQKNLKLLSMPIQLEPDSVIFFWQHMEHCHNLLHPYNRIVRTIPDAGDMFVDKIMDVVSSFGANPDKSPDIGGMLQQITGDQGFMQGMSSMFGTNNGEFDPSVIGQIFEKFTKTLGNFTAPTE